MQTRQAASSERRSIAARGKQQHVEAARSVEQQLLEKRAQAAHGRLERERHKERGEHKEQARQGNRGAAAPLQPYP